jgi:uncharacterized YkwD family protein
MKRRIAFLIMFVLLFTTISGLMTPNIKKVDAAPTFQKVNFVNGVVTATALNVRQGPSTNYKKVCVLYKGQSVKVFGKIGNWYAIYETKGGCVGAAHSKYIKIAGATKQPAPTPAPQPKPTPAPTPAPSPEKPPEVPPMDVSEEEQQLLDLVNKARADAGVAPLAFDKELMNVARIKAKDMVENNYFSHQSPTYGSPFDMMKQFGITFKTAGENIAGNRTVEGAFKAWMGSEGHRRNILNGKFNHTGIGIVPSKTYGNILVQQFIGK